MFTWICPKCGKEVPPSYSECPNCAAAAAEPTPTAVPEPAARPAPPAAAPPAAEPQATAPPRPVRPAQTPVASGGKVAVPWWLLVLLIALGFGALGFGFISWHEQRQATSSAAPTAAPVFEQPSAAGAQTSPEFRNVELTGLRLTENEKQKAFVQFIVVNHSGADLGDIAGTVQLKAVTKQDREPVGTFSFKTKLGPYESKDLREPLETKLRVYELPDWQFLRAEIAAK